MERAGVEWGCKVSRLPNCLVLGIRGSHLPPCTHVHAHTHTYTHTHLQASPWWVRLSLTQAEGVNVPAPWLRLAWPGCTYLGAGFYCPVQPPPSGLDATPLGLNLGSAPGCCPFQGACQLPQRLHLGLSQALNFPSESIKLLFQHLRGQSAGEGHSGVVSSRSCSSQRAGQYLTVPSSVLDKAGADVPRL